MPRPSLQGELGCLCAGTWDVLFLFDDPLSLCEQLRSPLRMTPLPDMAPQVQSPQAGNCTCFLVPLLTDNVRRGTSVNWWKTAALQLYLTSPCLDDVGKTEHRGRTQWSSSQSKCINQGLQINLKPGFMQVLHLPVFKLKEITASPCVDSS